MWHSRDTGEVYEQVIVQLPQVPAPATRGTLVTGPVGPDGTDSDGIDDILANFNEQDLANFDFDAITEAQVDPILSGSEPPGEDGEEARLTAWVRGRVQGVGFRWWVRRNALELGLIGMAENLVDGRVKIVAEGG